MLKLLSCLGGKRRSELCNSQNSTEEPEKKGNKVQGKYVETKLEEFKVIPSNVTRWMGSFLNRANSRFPSRTGQAEFTTWGLGGNSLPQPVLSLKRKAWRTVIKMQCMRLGERQSSLWVHPHPFLCSPGSSYCPRHPSTSPGSTKACGLQVFCHH